MPTAPTAPENLLAAARASGLMIATAESCTGGLVSGALTDVPGASDVFDRGFVTYSNAAKIAQLGVPAALIEAHGAVSGEVAAAMAEGALVHSVAQLAIAITGIAGPGGGSVAKPEGLVWFAVALDGSGITTHERRFGALGRRVVREASVDLALTLAMDRLTTP